MTPHEKSAGLSRPHDLLDKLRDDFLRLRRSPRDPRAAFDFFATAAHLPSWIEVSGGPNACQLPPTPLLKAARQIADGEASLRIAMGPADERRLTVKLDGWPARALGSTVKVGDLASQVLVYWETLEFFADEAADADD
jgi:hypothetical protein